MVLEFHTTTKEDVRIELVSMCSRKASTNYIELCENPIVTSEEIYIDKTAVPFLYPIVVSMFDCMTRVVTMRRNLS